MIKSIERTKDGIDALIDGSRKAIVDATNYAERGVESAAQGVVASAHSAGEYLRDGSQVASRDAHRHLEVAAKAIDHGYVRARSDLSRAATAASDYLAENPGKALLLATTTGFALGMLVRRRRLSAEA